jgi:hypothetical protein
MSRSERPGIKLADQDPNAASNLALTASSALLSRARRPPSCRLACKVTDVTSANTAGCDGAAADALPLRVLARALALVLALTAALLTTAVVVGDSVLDTAAVPMPLEEALSGAWVEDAVAVNEDAMPDCEGATDVATTLGKCAGERVDVATTDAEAASGLADGTTGGRDADALGTATMRPTVRRSMAVKPIAQAADEGCRS